MRYQLTYSTHASHNIRGAVSCCILGMTEEGYAAVAYGLERINSEVAAWMRRDLLPGGQFAQPPFEAMG